MTHVLIPGFAAQDAHEFPTGGEGIFRAMDYFQMRDYFSERSVIKMSVYENDKLDYQSVLFLTRRKVRSKILEDTRDGVVDISRFDA